MKIQIFSDEIEWLQARKTKITGSKLKDIVILRGTEDKKGFYELVAERLATPRPDGENVMQRGKNLEKEAVCILESELGKTFNKDLVMWIKEDNESIAISPDAYTKELTEAVEVKCLCSADHIKAVIKNEYPDEYKFQVYQYFIVNDKLETLYFVIYDPSLSVKQFIYFIVDREDIKDEIEKYLQYEIDTLKRVNDEVNKLSF